MGRIYLEYYSDNCSIYKCNQCSTHLTKEDEVISRVLPTCITV